MLKYPFNYGGKPPAPTDIFRGAYHPGIDYPIGARTAVIAATAGQVVIANNSEVRQWVANTPSDPYKTVILGRIIPRKLKTDDYGKFVKIYHGMDSRGRKIHTLYAHLDSVEVKVGDKVAEGQLIGFSDSTGNSTGNHLHYEIRVNDICVDPYAFDLSFKGKGGERIPYSVYETTVSILPGKYVLNVRSDPNTSPESTILNRLYSGDTNIKVKGYVKGEEVDGNPWWYVSSLDRYFWAKGTTSPIPRPEEMKNVNIFPLVDLDRKENLMKLQELEEKRNSLVAEIAVKKTELVEVEKAIDEEKAKPVEDVTVAEPEVSSASTSVEVGVTGETNPPVTEETVVVEPSKEEVSEEVTPDEKKEAKKLLENLGKLLGL